MSKRTGHSLKNLYYEFYVYELKSFNSFFQNFGKVKKIMFATGMFYTTRRSSFKVNNRDVIYSRYWKFNLKFSP